MDVVRLRSQIADAQTRLRRQVRVQLFVALLFAALAPCSTTPTPATTAPSPAPTTAPTLTPSTSPTPSPTTAPTFAPTRHVFRFTISITQTMDARPWVGPPHPVSIRNALDLWLNKVNAGDYRTSSGQRIGIEQVDPWMEYVDSPDPFPNDVGAGLYMNDRGDEQVVRRIYASISSRTGDGAPDLYFCPSRWSLVPAATEVAARTDALWICWAFEPQLYLEPPLSEPLPSATLKMVLAMMAARLSEQQTSSVERNAGPQDIHNGSLSLSLKFNGWMPEVGQHFINGHTANTHLGDNASGLNIFDLNVRKEDRWSNSLALVRNQGGRRLILCYDEAHKSQVEGLRKAAIGLGYSDVMHLELYAKLLHKKRFALVSGIMQFKADIIIVIANLPVTVWFIMCLRGHPQSIPKSLVAGYMQGAVMEAVDGHTVSGMLSPMDYALHTPRQSATTVFQTLNSFTRQYNGNYFSDAELDFLVPSNLSISWNQALLKAFKEIPPLSALQIAAAGELYTNALTQAPNTTVAGLREAMLSASGTSTLLGMVHFNNAGLRLNPLPNCSAAWTRQYAPDPNADHVNRYYGTSFGPRAERKEQYRATLEYPMKSQADRTVDLYPCAPGCAFQSLKCQECPAGYYRGEQDNLCLRCEPGTFSNDTGVSACSVCPDEGADCSDRKLPTAAADYHLVTMEETTVASPLVSINSVLDRPDDCPKRKTARRTHYIFRCLTRGLCLQNGRCYGNNTGLLCGQCPYGYSFQNIFSGNPGKRRCMECLGPLMSHGSLAFMIILYGLLLQWFQKCGIQEARQVKAGTCPTIRVVVHYLQLMLCAWEAAGLDGETPAAILLTPLNWLYRPLKVIWWDCTYAEMMGKTPMDGPATAYIDDQVRAAANLLPFGIGVILGLHIAGQLIQTGLQDTNAVERFRNFVTKQRQSMNIPAKWDRKWYKVGRGAAHEVVLIRRTQSPNVWVVAKPDLSLGTMSISKGNLRNEAKDSWPGADPEEKVAKTDGKKERMMYVRVPMLTGALRSRLRAQADALVASGFHAVSMPKDGDPAERERVKTNGCTVDDLPEFDDVSSSDEEFEQAEHDSKEHFLDEADFDDEEDDDDKDANQTNGLSNGVEANIVGAMKSSRSSPQDSTERANRYLSGAVARGSTGFADKITLSQADIALGRLHSAACRGFTDVGPSVSKSAATGPIVMDVIGLAIHKSERDDLADEVKAALSEQGFDEDVTEPLHIKVYIHHWKSKVQHHAEKKPHNSHIQKRHSTHSFAHLPHLHEEERPSVRIQIKGPATEDKTQRHQLVAFMKRDTFTIRGIPPSFYGIDGTHNLDDRKDEATDAPKKYKIDEGAGKQFNRMHIWFHHFDQNMHLSRKILAFLVIGYAPLLRGVAEGFMCTSLSTRSEDTKTVVEFFTRVTSNFDVLCSDKNMEVTRLTALFLYTVLAASVPLLVLGVMYKYRHEYATPDYRRAFIVLHSGYKPRWKYWEVLRMCRLAMFIFAGTYLQDKTLKVAAMGAILMGFVIVQLLARPYAVLNRFFLAKFEIASSWAVLTILSAAFVQNKPSEQPDFEEFVAIVSQDTLNNMALLGALIANLGVLFFGFFVLLCQDLALTARIYQSAGYKLGTNTELFLRFVRLFWGLNTVTVLNDDTNTIYVNSLRLASGERNFLEQSMGALLRVCVLCGSKFYPSLLVVALQEGFERAVEARSALMRSRDERLGIGTKEVVRNCGIRVGRVFQTAPDIIQQFDHDPDDEGVTVEELGDAFEILREDLHANHPGLAHRMKEHNESTRHRRHRVDVREWQPNETLDQFFLEMSAAGRSIQGMQYCPAYAHQWEPMIADGKWICMQISTKSGSCKMAHRDPAQRLIIPDYSTASKLRCAVCGLEVCGDCHENFQRLSAAGSAYWVKAMQASSDMDEDIAVQRMNEDDLDDALLVAEKETVRLENLLTKIALESKYKSPLVSGSPSVTTSPAVTPKQTVEEQAFDPLSFLR